MVLENPHFDLTKVPPQDLSALAFHERLEGYQPTPIHSLAPNVFMKDESDRLGLPAFKILGASWAIEQALAEHPGTTTLVAASAGNHGRAVARVARTRGLQARIYLPERSLPARREAIRSEGAELHVVDGTYEDAVALAEADTQGLLITDVGDTPTAHDVIDGYATLFAEIPEPPDVLVVPVGVGALAAAAARYGAATGIEVVGVEPATAACLTASLDKGTPTKIETPGTTMAGLDCAEVSPAAWPSLKYGIQLTVTVTDDEARAAQLELEPHLIGESGAAPYAALAHLGIDTTDTRVLLIATEGRTGDP